MKKKCPYNPRKCTSDSSLSGCIHQYLSKTIMSIPTRAEYVDLFEKTLIGGFSCVNTRLAFDFKILFLRDSVEARKENLKLFYKKRNSEKQKLEDKRIVSKISKTDENNQYGNAMTKLLPTGSIKKAKNKKMKKMPTMIYWSVAIKYFWLGQNWASFSCWYRDL